MARIERDSIMDRTLPLQEGETVLAEFRADRMAYWRGHLILAVVLGAAAGLFLMWQGNPYPVAGPIGAVLAIGARAAYLASEALTETWRLTDRRLLGPGDGRNPEQDRDHDSCREQGESSPRQSHGSSPSCDGHLRYSASVPVSPVRIR